MGDIFAYSFIALNTDLTDVDRIAYIIFWS